MLKRRRKRCEETKEMITNVAKQVIGEKRSGRNEDWFNQDCRDAIKDKNEAKIATLNRNTRRAQCIQGKEKNSKKNLQA